jgi:hypothetical protein
MKKTAFVLVTWQLPSGPTAHAYPVKNKYIFTPQQGVKTNTIDEQS